MTSVRVNQSFLPFYKGQVVRLICKVTSVNGKVVEVQASDGGKVVVNAQNEFRPGNVTEIIGRVNDDLSIEEFNSTPFSDNFDFDTFEQLVRLMHMNQPVFGTAAVQ